MKGATISLVLVLAAVTCAAPAAPVQWTAGPGANLHWYELVYPVYPVNLAGSIAWDDAKAGAEARSWMQLPGYLATITSGAEGDFIQDNIVIAPDSPWIGGYQPPGNPEPDGSWAWVTGEPWDYVNWSPGEPNNSAGDENSLQLSWDLGWNDANGDALLDCYVVEYVPEPATLGMFALCGFALWRRKGKSR